VEGGSGVVCFGECELDLQRMELRRGGEPVPVEPQVFDVLAYLIHHGDRLVPKHELLDEIWGSRFVSESALTSRIKSARRAIGDTGRDQRIIRTVHGRGYRFVAHRTECTAEDAGAPAPLVVGNADAPTIPASGAALDGVASLLSRLASGGERGVTVSIVGPLGAGKSQALHRLAEEAAAAGLTVGRASAGGLLMQPAQAVIDAIDEMVHRRPSLLAELSDPCRSELERVLSGSLPSTRPRLFLALRELIVAAASTTGAVVVIDDLHLGDSTTREFVAEAARLTRHHRLALVVAHDPSTEVLAGSTVVALERRAGRSGSSPESALAPETVEALRRIALGGVRFDVLEANAATELDEATTARLIDVAVATGVVERVAGAYRFVDGDVVDRLVESIPPARAGALRRGTGLRLARAGAAPERVAAHLLAAGAAREAVPYAMEAARRAAQADLHADVLRWTAAVSAEVDDPDAPGLLALRADAMAASGDAGAVATYRQALRHAAPGAARSLRARMARAALLVGDLATAEEALAGLEPDGGAADGAILLARGMYAYFTGDLDSAERSIEAAKPLALVPGAPDRLLDVITLEGLVAHNRGEWFDRLRRELRSSRDDPRLASTVFDSHLCVAEYLLYGPTPYAEVIELTTALRSQAQRIGARRAEAFAASVIGEAALLAGDLDLARSELAVALDMHQEMRADTGTAHALQRLAEVELAGGDPEAAERLLRRALPLARWSPLARHLLQRIYGTLIAAAPDTDAAMAVVGEALGVMDDATSCVSCQIMLAVPASIACAEAGRLDDAAAFIVQAEISSMMWQGTAWQGAIAEARAHLERARGHTADADRLLEEAAQLFAAAGHPLEVERCRDSIGI
jgi:DNA-binding winged helix-turn-helix (wHTH) protein/tetratricopeptide (TPR) repeat protein